MLLILCIFASCLLVTNGFTLSSSSKVRTSNTLTTSPRRDVQRTSELRMNIVNDAFRFFSNMNKEASAKHILISGPEAVSKLNLIKNELVGVEDLSNAFSELASKVSECPSAKRGGNLGTFKPGMMVREFDEVCFEKELGVVHGPVETQFGAHLILITRRYEGDNKK